ncbi:hypothetical protein BH09BAC5_BH09BAC5_29360 [soil metagenome]
MKKTILVIEDNKDICDNTAELLDLAGYATIIAYNGKEGLERARDKNPDLVLCDIMMPELDGYGVLRAMSNIPELRTVPFVFLTAKSEKEDFRKGMDLGADDYLTKPFEGDTLLRVVESRLKKSSMLKIEFPHSAEGIDAFFKQVASLDEIIKLSSQRINKKLKSRTMIFMEGDSANFLYFIVSGKIKIFRTNEHGKEFITEIHNEGSFFGYQALLEETIHRQSAMALEDSEIIQIPKQDFFTLLFSNNEIAIKFIRFISNSKSESENKLLKLAYDSARKRVAEALLLISNKYNPDRKALKPFPEFRENISALAGISPESVSRNLTDFREEGLIETNNGEILIRDMEKLINLKG